MDKDLLFDRDKLTLKPLGNRIHDLSLKDYYKLSDEIPAFEHPSIPDVAECVKKARQNKKPVILMMGAHLLRSGNACFINDLVNQGYITHIAGNGAVAIHDFEMALIGATTESVARYIKTGEFGLWKETSLINDAVITGVKNGLGYGESIAKWIVDNSFPYSEYSILATAYKKRIPFTIHIGIGYDITCEMPNYSGVSSGEASYMDFLCFAKTIENLEGGVFLNFGSAVMGPEVYLKALSMARNVAFKERREIKNFSTAVFDIMPLDENTAEKNPEKSNPFYYFRPWKTILCRTVEDGGKSYFIKGDHKDTFPALYKAIMKQ